MLRPVQVWRWRVLALWLLRTVTYGCGHIHVIDPWWGRLAGFNKWITVFLSFLIHSVTDCKVRSLIIILFKYKINDIMLKEMQFNTYSQRTEVWSNILPLMTLLRLPTAAPFRNKPKGASYDTTCSPPFHAAAATQHQLVLLLNSYRFSVSETTVKSYFLRT